MASSLLGAALLVRCAFAAQINPEIYARFLAINQPMYDKIASLVVEKLGSDATGNVLDVGSGPGEPTLTLAKIAPHVTIKCTDYQAAMVEKAKGRIAAADSPELKLGERISFDATSADALVNLRDQDYDVVIGNYVLMFVPDRAKAMREFRRVLRPAKTALVSYWKHLPLYDMALEATRQVAGAGIEAFAINPLALKEDGVVQRLADDAGFTLAGTHSITYDFAMGPVQDAIDSLIILAGEVVEREEVNRPGAMKQFYEVAEKLMREKGWVGADGKVVIPKATAEILVLIKGDRTEL